VNILRKKTNQTISDSGNFIFIVKLGFRYQKFKTLSLKITDKMKILFLNVISGMAVKSTDVHHKKNQERIKKSSLLQ
jgi:hypothetical protein